MLLHVISTTPASTMQQTLKSPYETTHFLLLVLPICAMLYILFLQINCS